MHAGGCVLNFTLYPYQPSGECIGSQQRIKLWGSLRTTLCCQNALTTLSRALARRAHDTQNSAIFLEQGLWEKCSGPFLRQPSVSADTCGFGRLLHGTSPCTSLTLQDVKQRITYKDAIKACSGFGNFNDACSNCTTAIMNLRDELMMMSGSHKMKGEKAMCAVAAVVSVASESVDDSFVNGDFFQCLTRLRELDPDYIKIKNSLGRAVLAILIAVMVVMLIIVLIKYVTKKKIDPKRGKNKSKEYKNTWSGLYRFSKEEIENAIYFGNEILGRGSAGHVYKGILPSGQEVAIKYLNQNGEAESFRREVEGLSRIRHPNLVYLFGFCMEDDCYYLVYEYCAGGNLAQQLLKKDTALNWEKRVRILRDCAYALKYLHHFMEGCIVHRDIKLTNILLTENLEPKLSDFGLAKIMNIEESKVFTDVRGTIGYMDPEYVSNAKLTSASDIYSFGIVALQILSGQKVIELNLNARDHLTRKAKDVSLGNRSIHDFEDPRLKGKFNKADFKSILEIAVLCVAKSSEDRPNIDMVFFEMDKAWKNTNAYKKMKKKQEPSTSSAAATPATPSLDVIPV
ncbi:putative LRR receptor-like serine/threonine-protein kinase [Morus notabilis]|uniref:Putative LRR receptor-like serine/threonine-protein kinase n=1 Tax=Morus notabilis TaxID=981085 RepID=W9S276_9ROSA|nr:probable LRR receptor-like serine/threonine-protein kinase At5g48740 [Morus notabilis]EXC21748.1 putative LRR receptor-like serine/threonine-protein kinase [Morus notabilis]